MPADRSASISNTEKENPGELTDSTGVEAHEEVSPLGANDTLENIAYATAIWAKRAAFQLERVERVAFAWAALSSLDPDDALATVERVIAGAGSPLPPFLALMHDARFWASLANRQELKAYALASFEAMRPADQSAFLDHVQGRTVA